MERIPREGRKRFFESLWKKAPMGCEVAEERFREKKIEDQGGGGERRGGVLDQRDEPFEMKPNKRWLREVWELKYL